VVCDKKPKQDIYPTAITPEQSMTYCCGKMFFMEETGFSLLSSTKQEDTFCQITFMFDQSSQYLNLY
jgi:hypothetical protein